MSPALIVSAKAVSVTERGRRGSGPPPRVGWWNTSSGFFCEAPHLLRGRLRLRVRLRVKLRLRVRLRVKG